MGRIETIHVDKFGNAWPDTYELCPDCGQPDNCGDCTHKQLTTQEVRFLGGWLKLESQQKFHQLHYNFVAKRLRNHYPMGGDSITDGDLIYNMGSRRTIEDIAFEFAERFKEDNPDFDALKFLDQCSPDPDVFPFSEMWEERANARG